MDAIKMVDLHKQYLNIRKEIDMAMQEVLDSTAFIQGRQVTDFRDKLARYLDVKHVIPCANGTDALQIALMALDLKAGDEVITPDFSFVAAAEVIALLGLKPVLVDVDPQTFTIDASKISAAITPKTRAIIPVHLYGLCANMKEISAIAAENELYIIEDTAQALGAHYHNGTNTAKAGTLGTIGCTSFFPSKNLGCFGDGGAIFTNDDLLAEKMQQIANHGAKIKYYHEIVGMNSRLDTLQASILNVKLDYLDRFNNLRQQAAHFYNEHLHAVKEIITSPYLPDYSNHVYHQYTITINEDRDDLKSFLLKKGIPSMVYYPVPIHKLKAYSTNKSFPVSDRLTKTVLSLPMHTELSTEQQEYICNAIIEFID